LFSNNWISNTKILPTVLLLLVNRVWKDVNFSTILTNVSIYELLFLNIFSPKLVTIKCIPLYLDLPEYGDLIFETRSKVQAYIWILISVMCICWYKWMINLDSVFISVEIFDSPSYVQRSGPKTQHLFQ
jgi:hypothetical protein